jgi:hypothetical protein
MKMLNVHEVERTILTLQKKIFFKKVVSESVNYIEDNRSARSDFCAIEYNLETNQEFYICKVEKEEKSFKMQAGMT